mgnify:CR=1 FL=1
MIGMRWLLTKKGLGSSNHFESCAFIRSKAGVKWPDIQYHFLPGAITYDGSSAFQGHGFQVHVGYNKPTSRGSVKAISPNIGTQPKILFNYLSTENDREGFRACVRLTREIMSQASMSQYKGEAIQPKDDVISDEQIDSFVRASVDSAYHPSCTCKIGQDKTSVVDHELKVNGVKGLRVIDSSVFPTIPNGNLNAPTMMVAERASDLIVLNSGVGAQEYQLDWMYQKQVIDVNVSGLVLMSTMSMEYFIKRGRGHIVGVSSIAAHVSTGLALTYCASKAFVSSYLNGLRSRARNSKLPITITTIEPGYVDTPMVKGSPPWTASVDKAVRQMIAGIESKRPHIFITRRYRFVVWMLKLIPNWIIRRYV